MSTALMRKPQKDTDFAHSAAVVLKDIVEQNGWAIAFNNGASRHLKYEAWQTIGKYYGYTVKTLDAVFIKYGEIEGFEAKAIVVDNKTGIEIGGAEAACMRDEQNWKGKPLFQLKSMAQTRAGAKALRQILGFAVALAGYNPTPAEEMISVIPSPEDDKDEEEWLNEQKSDKCTCHTSGKFHRKDCPAFTFVSAGY